MAYYKRTSGILTSVLILALVGILLPALAVTVADPNDRFEVVTPGANTVVSGSFATSFIAFDDDAANITYNIRLTRPNCLDAVSTIASDTKPSNNSAFNVSWNSATVPDANYCHTVCVNLKDSAQDYSACASSLIRVKNNNRAPTFTNNIASTVNLTVNQNWEFTIRATDPDADTITYELINAPNFLSINPLSGRIFTNSNAKTVGSYSVQVRANDGFNGISSQSTVFNITNPAPPTPPAVTPPPVTPPAPTTPVNVKTEFEFLTPKLGSQLEQGIINITWLATDTNGFGSLELFYAENQNAEEFIEIVKISTNNINQYEWDTSSLNTGDYYLKAVYTDSLSSQETFSSGVFSLLPKQQVPEPNADVIIQVTPENNSTVKGLRPKILGEFTYPESVQLVPNTFKILINDTNITPLCKVNAQSFECNLANDLQPGLQKVVLSISDDEENQFAKEWVFTLEVDALAPVTGSNGLITAVSNISFGFIGLICLIILILLLVPFLLYRLWKRRSTTQSTVVETTTYTPLPVLPSSPISSTSTEQVFAAPEVVNPTAYENYQDYFAAVTDPGSSPGQAPFTSPEQAPKTEVTVNHEPLAPAAAVVPSSEAGNKKETNPPQAGEGADLLASIYSSQAVPMPIPAAEKDTTTTAVTTTEVKKDTEIDLSKFYATEPAKETIDTSNDDIPDWLSSTEAQVVKTSASETQTQPQPQPEADNKKEPGDKKDTEQKTVTTSTQNTTTKTDKQDDPYITYGFGIPD